MEKNLGQQDDTEELICDEDLEEAISLQTKLIVPWDQVRKRLQKIIKQVKSNLKHANEEVETHTTNMFLPQGISPLRSIPTQNGMRRLIYMPFNESDRFATADMFYAYLWKGSNRIAKKCFKPSYSTSNSKTDIIGLSEWVWAPQWKVIIIGTARLELKICDSSLNVFSMVKCPSPIVSMLLVRDLLVIGCVGKVIVWSMQQPSMITDGLNRITLGPIEFRSIEITMDDFDDEDWIKNLAYNENNNYLYASYENKVNVFDFNTGMLILRAADLHSNSITSLLYLESAQCLVTGGMDSLS